PSNTITCADASSHLAIGEAFRTIQRGDADLAICGGAESKVNLMGLIRHCLLKRLTESNDAPDQSVRPFDSQASGTAIAEAAGLSRIPFAPIKSPIGNLAAGSGVDAATAAPALHHNTAPPATNTKKVLDGQTLNVSPEAREQKIDVAISSVYSLGGQNAALV